MIWFNTYFDSSFIASEKDNLIMSSLVNHSPHYDGSCGMTLVKQNQLIGIIVCMYNCLCSLSMRFFFVISLKVYLHSWSKDTLVLCKDAWHRRLDRDTPPQINVSLPQGLD